MNWHFHGKIASKCLLPAASKSYHIEAAWSVSEPLTPNLRKLLESARTTVSLTTVLATTDHLRNQLEKGEPILKQLKSGKEVSYAQYWHDLSRSDHLFAITFGLPDDELALIDRYLEDAFLHCCEIGLTTTGGFSTVFPNRYSPQPTQEHFETGLPLQLQFSSIVVKAPSVRRDHES